jgi:membrane protein DedA with SNARE-associated domain
MTSVFKAVLDWYMAALETGGHWLVASLLALENSFFPLPAELVVPPAAHLAANEQRFSVAGVVLAGAVGSWLGASVLYWLARVAGRPFVLRYGRYVFITPARVEKAEQWVARFGPAGVLASRFLPGVRHVIGIPAGVLRMNFALYSFYTLLGSAVYCGFLAWLGVVAGQDEELLAGRAHRVSLWVGGGLAASGILYFLVVRRLTKDGCASEKQRSTVNFPNYTGNNN